MFNRRESAATLPGRIVLVRLDQQQPLSVEIGIAVIGEAVPGVSRRGSGITMRDDFNIHGDAVVCPMHGGYRQYLFGQGVLNRRVIAGNNFSVQQQQG